MNITYREASEDDLKIILELMNEFYIVDHLHYDENVIKEGLKKLFSNKAYGSFWLISADGTAAGYIIVTHGFSLEYHGVDALVDEFYIREQYRGKGIGTQTLHFIEKELAKKNIKAFHLEVIHRNNSAKRMYTRFGFEDHDRYLMTKWLKN